MEDLISRQDAIDAMVKYVADGYADSVDDFEGYTEIIKSIPSARPTEIANAYTNGYVEGAVNEALKKKKGEWIRYGKDDDVYDLKGVHTWGVKYQCPFCGEIHTLIEDFGQWHFCPNCGADMRGGDSE